MNPYDTALSDFNSTVVQLEGFYNLYWGLSSLFQFYCSPIRSPQPRRRPHPRPPISILL